MSQPFDDFPGSSPGASWEERFVKAVIDVGGEEARAAFARD